MSTFENQLKKVTRTTIRGAIVLNLEISLLESIWYIPLTSVHHCYQSHTVHTNPRALPVCHRTHTNHLSLLLSRPASFNQYSSRTNANKHLRIHHHLRVLVSRGLYKAFTFTLLYFISRLYQHRNVAQLTNPIALSVSHRRAQIVRRYQCHTGVHTNPTSRTSYIVNNCHREKYCA